MINELAVPDQPVEPHPRTEAAGPVRPGAAATADPGSGPPRHGPRLVVHRSAGAAVSGDLPQAVSRDPGGPLCPLGIRAERGVHNARAWAAEEAAARPGRRWKQATHEINHLAPMSHAIGR